MSTEDWRESWVAKKIKLARDLEAGTCGAGYAEAAMILCGVLSALAAEVWPGKNKDRARFVELLACHTAPELGASTVSIPLLAGRLRKEGQTADEAKLRAKWLAFDGSRVVYGTDVDTTEANVRHECPGLSLALIRSYSYAALVYTEIRSGYTHEYQPGEQSDSFPMGRRPDASISYINRTNERLIYFGTSWMAALAKSAERMTRQICPDAAFKEWWVNGSVAPQ